MMKKFTWLLIPFLLLAACGTEEEGSSGTGDLVEEIEVAFNTETQADPAEAVTLSVTVTQGDGAVEDADEVVYEVWQSGYRDASEMIPAKHTENGVYEADTSFDEEGLYYIQAHTTARSLHVMPKQEITVGNPDPASILEDDGDDAQGMDKMKDHSGH